MKLVRKVKKNLQNQLVIGYSVQLYGAKPKCKSHWGEPVSQEDQLLASAINTFDHPSMQERIEKFRQQMIEQQEVGSVCVCV